MIITIPGELPSLNEIIAEAKSNKFRYSKSKKDYTEICGYCALAKKHIEGKVDVSITWYTKDERKDPDNVACGIKYILDGFVQAGLLMGDGRKYIGRISHDFEVDKKEPRVEVELRPIGAWEEK